MIGIKKAPGTSHKQKTVPVEGTLIVSDSLCRIAIGKVSGKMFNRFKLITLPSLLKHKMYRSNVRKFFTNYQSQ